MPSWFYRLFAIMLGSACIYASITKTVPGEMVSVGCMATLVFMALSDILKALRK